MTDIYPFKSYIVLTHSLVFFRLYVIQFYSSPSHFCLRISCKKMIKESNKNLMKKDSSQTEFQAVK